MADLAQTSKFVGRAEEGFVKQRGDVNLSKKGGVHIDKNSPGWFRLRAANNWLPLQ
jgi:hypothetical protein